MNGWKPEAFETVASWPRNTPRSEYLGHTDRPNTDPRLCSYQSYKYGKNEVTNLCGNSKKSLHVSFRESLKKLQTDYVSPAGPRSNNLELIRAG